MSYLSINRDGFRSFKGRWPMLEDDDWLIFDSVSQGRFPKSRSNQLSTILVMLIILHGWTMGSDWFFNYLLFFDDGWKLGRTNLSGFMACSHAKTIELFGRKMVASVFLSPYRHVGSPWELNCSSSAWLEKWGEPNCLSSWLSLPVSIWQIWKRWSRKKFVVWILSNCTIQFCWPIYGIEDHRSLTICTSLASISLTNICFADEPRR